MLTKGSLVAAILNSEIKSRIHPPTWKGIPRRVHATVTNPAWITIIANSDVECILRAKTLQLYLTGIGWWKDPRMNAKKLSPKSMLDEISWQIATAVQKLWNLQKRDAGSGLSRLPLTRNEKWRRYADWRPNLYHQIKWVSSLVAVPNGLPLPPALKWILKLKTAVEVDRASRRENRNPNEQQKTTSSGRSFTSVVHTHTHTPFTVRWDPRHRSWSYGSGTERGLGTSARTFQPLLLQPSYLGSEVFHQSISS